MRVFELRSRDRFVIRFAHDAAPISSLSSVFVETFVIFTYLSRKIGTSSAGGWFGNNLVPRRLGFVIPLSHTK
jgi:hypothetical protein